MSWETRQNRKFYYRVKRDSSGRLVKTYYGTGRAAQWAFLEDLRWQQDREQARTAKRAEKAQLHALDAQSDGLGKRIRLLASAVLTVNGYYQHQRESYWRKRRGSAQTPHYIGLEEHMMTWNTDTEDREDTRVVEEDILHTIQRGQAADKDALPMIRTLLDGHPVLWLQAKTLASEVERAWLQVLAGEDLVAQEMLRRQLQRLKYELGIAEVTPLEGLLIETLATHWLQLQDAQLRAAIHQRQHGYVNSYQEKRLMNANKLLEGTAKTLAQVQKRLRPKPAVINVAHQQVVNVA